MSVIFRTLFTQKPFPEIWQFGYDEPVSFIAFPGMDRLVIEPQGDDAPHQYQKRMIQRHSRESYGLEIRIKYACSKKDKTE